MTTGETFSMPKSLYRELKKAAADKHLTVKEYMDQFLDAILFGNWEALEKRKA